MKAHARSYKRILREHFNGPMIGAEIGVYKGYLSRILLQEFRDLYLYMVDAWLPYEGGFRPHRQPTAEDMNHSMLEAKEVTDFAANRRMILAADLVASSRLIPDNSLDWIFVDAGHLYEDVKRDLDVWCPKVKPGGLLTGHDYGTRLDKKRKRVGAAVDEYLQNYGHPPAVQRAGYIWVSQRI